MPSGTNKTIASGFSEFEWEVRESRTGVPTLLLGGRAVYSQYDPLKNAAQLAGQLKGQMADGGCDHLVLIGSGLGYLPAALFDAGVDRMIIWEPFPVMQKVFGHVYRDGPERVYNAEDFDKKVKAFAVPGSKPQLAIHPGYQLFCRLEYRYASGLLGAVYRQNGPGHIISRRTLETLERLPRLRSVASLRDRFRDRSVALVSPGPSLKSYLSALQDYRGTVISSFRAAPLLQEHGIRIDFLISSDVPDMSDLLSRINISREILLLDTCCHPGSLDARPERTFLFNLRSFQLHEKLWEDAGLPVFNEPMATVSEVMVRLAVFMGFARICCLGMDMCWSGERYTGDAVTRYDRDNTGREQQFMLSDLHGNRVISKAVYFQGARFLQSFRSGPAEHGVDIRQTDQGLDLGMDILDPAGLAAFGTRNDAGPASVADTGPEITVSTVDSLLEEMMSTGQDAPVRKAVPTAVRPQVALWEELHELPGGERGKALAESRSRLNG